MTDPIIAWACNGDDTSVWVTKNGTLYETGAPKFGWWKEQQIIDHRTNKTGALLQAPHFGLVPIRQDGETLGFLGIARDGGIFTYTADGKLQSPGALTDVVSEGRMLYGVAVTVDIDERGVAIAGLVGPKRQDPENFRGDLERVQLGDPALAEELFGVLDTLNADRTPDQPLAMELPQGRTSLVYIG